MEDQNNQYEVKARNVHNVYDEETAAEIAVPYDVVNHEDNVKEVTVGKGWGFVALFFSILSLFYAPFVWGVISVFLGFVAISKGRTSLGTWAIAISAIAMIIRMFILVF